MSLYLHKSHNVSCLIYHVVCPTKYRRVVITDAVDQTIKHTCLEIAKRYSIHFLEIGTDKDHVHFLVQSVPMYLPKNIVQTIKSINGREVFSQNPEVKKQLWGWGILDRRILHQYRRARRIRECSTRLREKPRQGR